MTPPEHVESWRLILDPPCDGPSNMAIDEAILEAVGQGNVPPTLRLYRWLVPCLSLGYAQSAADADRERIAARDWDLVRRMTGGRAILHVDELTYSVALPIEHPLARGTIVESYRRLSSALLAAVQALGLAASAGPRAQNAGQAGPICFEVPSDYEITANGRKLIGSAQVRKQHAALQHGSLPLYGDLGRVADALRFASEAERDAARARVLARATTFAEASGSVITWEAAAQAIAAAFQETFAIYLVESGLDAGEKRRAAELRLARYAADAWTFRS